MHSSIEHDIWFDPIAHLCPNTTGVELKSVVTEVCHTLSLALQGYHSDVAHKARMFVIHACRKVATECDFLDAIEKVV